MKEIQKNSDVFDTIAKLDKNGLSEFKSVFYFEDLDDLKEL